MKPYTLVIDIGGSGVKAIVVDAKRRPVSARFKEATPPKSTPSQVFDLVRAILKQVPNFDRVAVGFPGIVQNGRIGTAVNLGKGWVGMKLDARIKKITGKPTLATNDANLLGLGVIKGRGVEMLITLGTGMGTALYISGNALPNFELGHHPFKGDCTYEDVIGKAALKRHGLRKWNTHLKAVIELLQRIFVFDTLYISGGYSKRVNIKLAKNVVIVDEIDTLGGGVQLFERAT